MTLEERLEKNAKLLAKTKKKVEKKRAVAKAKLDEKNFSDEVYVSTILRKQATKENIESLREILSALGDIDSERLADGTEIKVNAYAISKSYFGEEVGLLLGVLTTLDSLYLDDHIEEGYLAVPGIDSTDVEDFFDSFGKTAYFSKRLGEGIEEERGNFKLAKIALQEIAEAMELDVDFKKFTEKRYNRYFELAQLRVDEKVASQNKAIAVAKAKATQGEGKLTLTTGEA